MQANLNKSPLLEVYLRSQIKDPLLIYFVDSKSQEAIYPTK